MSSSIKELSLAFFKGLAFGKGLIMGRELAENKDMAEDRWITIHPFGNMKQGEADTGEGKRYFQRIFINDETDEIEGGLGGKLNGTKISDMGENLRALREDKPLKMSDGQSGKTEEQEEVPKHVKEIDEKTERWKAAKARFKKRKEAEEAKAQKEAEEAKRKAEEEAQKPKDYAKEITDFIKEREEERLKPQERAFSDPHPADKSILDKEYYKDIKRKAQNILKSLNGDKYAEEAVENVKDKIDAILSEYSDTYTRSINLARNPDFSYDPEWTNFEKDYRDKLYRQFDELERYVKDPEKYKADIEQTRSDLKSINDELELRRKALAKLPNDRGTNSYLSKLLNTENIITESLKAETGLHTDKGKRWETAVRDLSGIEDVKANAEKLLKSVDKNPKYTDVLAKAKEGEYYKNISDVTKEQKERAEAREEKKQERVDRMRERADNIIKQGEERFHRGYEAIMALPPGQPNIEGRLTSYLERADRDQRRGMEKIKYGESLKARADDIEAHNEIRSDDPLAIQKLQQEVENSVGTRRAYYQKKLERALKTQERANTGSGLKKETKLYKLDEDFTDGRIRFRFDGKPRQEVIDIMKSRGFRWSPSNKAWQRQNTPNGVWSAKKVIEELKQYE